MKLLLLADTHVPKRAKDLPEEVWKQVEHVDVVVHAGDWVDVALLDELEGRSERLIGVRGTNDKGDLCDRLNERERFELDGLRFAVVHETGSSTKREQRCDDEWQGVDVLIFGHSHIPWDTTTPNGMRLLNPGSPTDRRRQPHCTYMTCQLTGHDLQVELHSL